MKAVGTWEGGYRTTLEDGRGHAVTVDLPLDEGGGDLGTSALELSVQSLAGCITTIFALVAKKRRLKFEELSVELEAHRPDGSPTITAVEGVCRVVTSGPAEDVETVLNITLRTCPVGLLYEHALIPVSVRPVVVPSPAALSPLPVNGGSTEPRRSGTKDHAHSHRGHLAGRAWTRTEALETLEAADRHKSQDPELLWTRVGLRPGQTVVDVGAGTGFFAVPAGRRVGPDGQVFAVDLSGELVDLLRERRDREGLPQLKPVQSTLSSIPLDSSVADVVLLANVLHDIPPSTVSEAVRLLKPEGLLVNLDWKKTDTPGGPPPGIRLTPDEAARRLEKEGLETVERWEFGPWHYGIVLRRSGSADSKA